MFVSADDVTNRLPSTVLPLTTHDQERVELFLEDVQQLLVDAFAREGRNLEAEVATSAWLGNAVTRVTREMVAASVIVGPNVNVHSASSTTGPQSDSVTFRDGRGLVSFSGPRLTDELRKELGLSVAVRSRGRFPRPPRWPEVRLP